MASGDGVGTDDVRSGPKDGGGRQSQQAQEDEACERPADAHDHGQDHPAPQTRFARMSRSESK